MTGAANNISFTMRIGDGDMVEPVFARAHHVTRLSLNNNRVTAVTMEPRGCIADYDPGTRRYTLYTSTQNVHGVRQTLAHQILHVPESRIRVVARDVGGGFGMKGQTYPEEAVAASGRRAASAGRSNGFRRARRRCSATIRVATRRSMPSWRSTRMAGSWHCAGAACTMPAPTSRPTGAIPIVFSLMLASTVYDIPAVAVTSSLVFTNTAPTMPYRGAGRPEAVYIMERLVDQAAREMQIDPAELRRKNLIRATPSRTRRAPA